MSLTKTTKSIQAAVVNLPALTEIKGDERLALLEACEQLKTALQTPFEATGKILFAPHQVAAVRIAIDVGLFDVFAAAKGVEISSAELAEKTKVEEVLLMRWIRMLAGMGLLRELLDGKYKASELGLAFASGSPYAHAAVFLGKIHEVLAKLPEYLKKTDYRNPEDAFDGPLQFVNGTKDHYFAWLESNPEEQTAFNYTMGIPRLSYGEEEWFDFFPVEKLLAGTSKDDVLLVDIGGGRGHDLQAFHSKYPSLPGRLILQDLPVVIDSIKNQPAAIEVIKHDFFTLQPIKGARTYYLRTVIHDWPDKQARKILEMIRPAMAKDSVLLLYELVVPDFGHSVWHAQMDITLMASLAALERTRQQWVNLLHSAGFELKAVWEPKSGAPGSGSLLEAVPR